MAVTTIEKALQDFVVAGTGLADANVIFADGKPRPNGPYVSMLIAVVDGHTTEVAWSRNATPTPGAEVIHTAREQVRCELQLQCFAPGATGTSTARAILRRLVLSAKLPAQRARLNAGGIGMIGFEPVQVTPAIQNVLVFEPRAVTVFAFNVAESVIETGTNIITVEVTPTISGNILPTRTISVDTP